MFQIEMLHFAINLIGIELCVEVVKNGTYSLAYSFFFFHVSSGIMIINWGNTRFLLSFHLLFFFVVLFVKISIFSGLLQGYVFYCQLISSPAFAREYLYLDLKIRSFYGIWNLDFFRFYDLGLCLKNRYFSYSFT